MKHWYNKYSCWNYLYDSMVESLGSISKHVLSPKLICHALLLLHKKIIKSCASKERKPVLEIDPWSRVRLSPFYCFPSDMVPDK